MSFRRCLLVGVVGVAVGGCGGASTAGPLPARTSAGELGRPIASVPSAPLPAVVPAAAGHRRQATPQRRHVAHPKPLQQLAEHVHLPTTSQTTSTARAVRSTVARFARAYLSYEIGRDPRRVRAAIHVTCTHGFATALLAQPASVPPAQRGNPAFAPGRLTAIRYTGQASFGPGPPVGIALARYRTAGARPARGALIVSVEREHGRWRVLSVRPQ